MRSTPGHPDWKLAHSERRAELETRLHLWLVQPDDVSTTPLADKNAGVLSDDEVLRWKRFIRPQDQHLFLVAHVLVRRVLSLYGDIAPGEWSFITNEYGRPEIEPSQQAALAPGSVLRFNLSHTHGMVALLVHDQVDAGVDVERTGRVDEPLLLAPTVFADEELAGLRGLSDGEVEDRFYRLWTLKESFIKAKGKGMAIPLKDFWFSIDDPDAISLDCEPTVDGHPSVWDFAVLEPVATYVVAAACARGGRRLDVFTPSVQNVLF